MKVIIAGSRHLVVSPAQVADIVTDSKLNLTSLVCGMARGIDMCGRHWALGTTPIHEFPADWTKYGNGAGPVRNQQMAEYADALILIWDGKSNGSADMKRRMLKLGKPVHEVFLKPTPPEGKRMEEFKGL